MADELAVTDVAFNELSTRIALQRERVDLRVRGKRLQAGDEKPADPAYGEFPRSQTVRLLLRYPILLGIAAGTIFAVGPKRLLGLASSGAAFWKMTAPLRH